MTDDRALLPFDEGNGRLTRRQWHDRRTIRRKPLGF